MSARFIIGDTREVVASLPDDSVDLILSSPPFLALRSYLPADHPDKAKEIGSESGPAEFVDTLLDLTAEWRRVLTPHGSMAIELGDTYSGSGGAGSDYGDGGMRDGQAKVDGSARRTRPVKASPDAASHRAMGDGVVAVAGGPGWPLAKCMTLVPELYRVALAYGRHPLTGQQSPAGTWRVRNVVRWVRPNPPVGALGDKFRPATSDMVIACTSAKRWFDLDAVRTEHKRDTTNNLKHGFDAGTERNHNHGRDEFVNGGNAAGAPPLDWWSISPSGYKGAHYATFPAELCVKPIEAMCPRRVCRTCGEPSRRETQAADGYADHLGESWADKAEGRGKANAGARSHHAGQPIGVPHIKSADYTTTGWSSCGCPHTDGIRLDGFHAGTGWRPGIVLDPFGGTGTTLVVAHGHGRDSIGVDLDPRNADLAIERLGLFVTIEHHDPKVAA